MLGNKTREYQFGSYTLEQGIKMEERREMQEIVCSLSQQDMIVDGVGTRMRKESLLAK